jgi:hypothetical protein
MLSDLEVLKLHDNDLTGSVPEEVCHLFRRNLATLTVDCSKVTCECDCDCTSDKNYIVARPPVTESPSAEANVPTEAVAEAAETEAPTASMTTSPVTDSPSTSATTQSPTLPPTEAATDEPAAVASVSRRPVTSMPTASPTQATAPPTMASTAAETVTVADGYHGGVVPNASSSYAPPDNADVVTAAADFMLQLPDYTKEALLNETSPQSLALEWLQGDSNLNTYSFTRKLQRFALATFFYSTKGMDAWIQKDDWLSYTEHECNWFATYMQGQICDTLDDGELVIRDLMLWGNGLDGPLPVS